MVGRIVQKRELLLDALRDFRKWYEVQDDFEDRLIRDEIDDTIAAIEEM